MATLRERQKSKARDEMIAAAESLFFKDGFEKTTMNSIAEEAGVGIATLFRYFKTKNGLLAELVKRDLNTIFAAGMEVIEAKPEDPKKAMLDLAMSFMRLAEMPSKQVTSQRVWWPGVPVGDDELDAVVIWSDEQVVHYIEMLLKHFKAQGKIDESKSMSDMADIIYCVFNQHYIKVITHREKSVKSVKRKLAREIGLLFDPWLK